MRSIAEVVGRGTGHDPHGKVAAWVWSGGGWTPHRYQVYLWNGSEYIPHSYVWNTGGLNGDAVTVNYAIPEGRSVMYIACLGESKTGEIFDCGDASYDTA